MKTLGLVIAITMSIFAGCLLASGWYLDRACTFTQAGDVDLALDNFRQANSLNPLDPWGRFFEANLLFNKEPTHYQLRRFEEVLAMSPYFCKVNLTYGQALDRMGYKGSAWNQWLIWKTYHVTED